MIGTGAVHGPFCNSKTYPIVCRYCQQPVFLFTCDCGCRVLFDDLGWPWPQHNCPNYLDYLIDRFGNDVIERGMEVMLGRRGIERRYVEQVQSAHRQQVGPAPAAPEIMREDPYAGVATTEQGIVRELIMVVDPVAKYGFEASSLLESALESVAPGPYAQITIHTEALAGNDHSSFTFFVSRGLVKKKKIVIGDYVDCSLHGFVLSESRRFWLCERLDTLYD